MVCLSVVVQIDITGGLPMVPELDLALVYLGSTTSSLSCRRCAVVGESLRPRLEENEGNKGKLKSWTSRRQVDVRHHRSSRQDLQVGQHEFQFPHRESRFPIHDFRDGSQVSSGDWPERAV